MHTWSHYVPKSSCWCGVGAQRCYTDTLRCMCKPSRHTKESAFYLICCLHVGSCSEKTFQRWGAFREYAWFILGCLTWWRVWFTERGTKSATLMWGRNAIHSARYRKQMLHLNGVLMPTQTVVAESQLIWAASLGGGKKGALYLDEARIDSLQWVSKPTWLWPTSLHKLWVYIGAEHNVCGAEIVLFFLTKFTLLQGCPPQRSLLIPTNSLHSGSSLRSHACFHVWLVRMFVTDCFCFSVRCNQFDLGHFFLLFFFFLYLWNFLSASCQMSGLVGYENSARVKIFLFLLTPEAAELMMRKIFPSCSRSKWPNKNTYRGPSDTQRRTDRRTLAYVFKENTVGQTTPEKVVRVWSLHLLLIKVSV